MDEQPGPSPFRRASLCRPSLSARGIFNDVVDHFRINADLRPSIYCTAIKYGGQAEWDFAWKQSHNVSSAQHRDDILSALGCSREPWILIRYLSFVMDPNSGVRKQDGRRVLGAVAGNPAGRRLAFEYVMKNFEKLFV